MTTRCPVTERALRVLARERRSLERKSIGTGRRGERSCLGARRSSLDKTACSSTLHSTIAHRTAKASPHLLTAQANGKVCILGHLAACRLLKYRSPVAKLFESLSPHEEVTQEECLRNAVNYEQTTYTKRTRTVSPSAAKRDLEAKRIERERQKQGRREREKQGRNEALFEQFVNSLYTDIPATSSPATNGLSIMYT